MTIILSTMFITTCLSMVFYRLIHKLRYFIYAVTFILALILFEEANSVTMGYIPFGIMLVVMLSGILDRSTLKKRLFMVRAELAIIACILVGVHGLSFLEYVLDDIGFFNMTFSFYLGVLSIIILIPLFITSFPFVRKHLGYKMWKKLHTLAYLFYGVVAFHLILIQNERMWLYIILFGFYFMVKSILILQKKFKTAHKKIPVRS